MFRIEKANQYADNTTTPKPTLTQDGEQIHQGIELGITGKVTENLTLIAGGTYMDLGVEKHTNKAIEGKKPIEAATKMAKLFAEYNIPFVSGLTVTGGAHIILGKDMQMLLIQIFYQATQLMMQDLGIKQNLINILQLLT